MFQLLVRYKNKTTCVVKPKADLSQRSLEGLGSRRKSPWRAIGSEPRRLTPVRRNPQFCAIRSFPMSLRNFSHWSHWSHWKLLLPRVMKREKFINVIIAEFFDQRWSEAHPPTESKVRWKTSFRWHIVTHHLSSRIVRLRPTLRHERALTKPFRDAADQAIGQHWGVAGGTRRIPWDWAKGPPNIGIWLCLMRFIPPAIFIGNMIIIQWVGLQSMYLAADRYVGVPQSSPKIGPLHIRSPFVPWMVLRSTLTC